MARTIRPFSPLENGKLTWAAAADSKSVVFAVTVGDPAKFPNVLKIDNQTDKNVFVRATVGASTAVVATDYEVKAGQCVYIDVGQKETVSVIPESSATGNVYLARGLGTA